MSDLFIGIGIVMLVSTAIFLLCVALFSRITPLARHLLLILAIVAMVPYALWGRDHLAWARYLPFSNLIILSNIFPEFIAVMAAELWVLWPKFPERRRFVVAMLAVLSVLVLCQPALRLPPICDDVWSGPVCRQTNNATCSPAAAATLLAHYGIPTTEQEMAGLCLTDEQGSLWMGIYRGLKLKTKGLGYRIEVGQYTLEQLKSMPGPFLLRSGLEKDAKVDPIYTEKWGWSPGQQHTVVLYRFTSRGNAMIGDPSVGLEFWTEENLSVLWHGHALRLVKEGPQPEAPPPTEPEQAAVHEPDGSAAWR